MDDQRGAGTQVEFGSPESGLNLATLMSGSSVPNVGRLIEAVEAGLAQSEQALRHELVSYVCSYGIGNRDVDAVIEPEELESLHEDGRAAAEQIIDALASLKAARVALQTLAAAAADQ